MDKYRNYRLWVDDTHGTREHSSVEFFPIKFQFPNNTPTDRLRSSVEDLVHELKPKHNEPNPTQPGYGTPWNQAIRQLRKYFKPATSDLTTFTKGNDESPRVQNHPSPRVGITNARSRSFEAGTKVFKEFINTNTKTPKIYKGAIAYYKHPYYRIIYDDGDFEDMTPGQVGSHISETNKANYFSSNLISTHYPSTVNNVLSNQTTAFPNNKS